MCGTQKDIAILIMNSHNTFLDERFKTSDFFFLVYEAWKSLETR